MAEHNQITHPVIDDDSALFTIDPVTRAITYNSPDELIIMQNDTNSERLTFEIPKVVEGHDMTLCNVVQIHYVNTGVNGSGEKPDIYPVELPLTPDPNDAEMLRFTWLVSRNATQLVGKVSFAIRFLCTDDADNILYEWSTGVSSDITIGTSIRNDTEYKEEVLSDVIAGLEDKLTYFYDFVSDPNNPESTERTFLRVSNLDGSVNHSDNLKGQTGEQGPQGVQGETGPTPTISIGSVKSVDALDPLPRVTVESYDDNNNPTLGFVLPEPERDYITDIKGNKMWFFSGTQAEYNDLPAEQKENLFALITDDAIAGSFVYGPAMIMSSVAFPSCSGNAGQPSGSYYVIMTQPTTATFNVPVSEEYDSVIINNVRVPKTTDGTFISINNVTESIPDNPSAYVLRQANFDGSVLTLKTAISGYASVQGPINVGEVNYQAYFIRSIPDTTYVTIEMSDLATFGSAPKVGEYVVNNKGFLCRITSVDNENETVTILKVTDHYTKTETNDLLNNIGIDQLTNELNQTKAELTAIKKELAPFHRINQGLSNVELQPTSAAYTYTITPAPHIHKTSNDYKLISVKPIDATITYASFEILNDGLCDINGAFSFKASTRDDSKVGTKISVEGICVPKALA